jgi:hypothetical protein
VDDLSTIKDNAQFARAVDNFAEEKGPQVRKDFFGQNFAKESYPRPLLS